MGKWSPTHDFYAFMPDLELAVWNGEIVEKLEREKGGFFWASDGVSLIYHKGGVGIVERDVRNGQYRTLLAEKHLTCTEESHPDCELSMYVAKNGLSPNQRQLSLFIRHEGPTVEAPPASTLSTPEEEMLDEEPRFTRERYSTSGLLLNLQTGEIQHVSGKYFPFWSPDSKLLCVSEEGATHLFDPTTGTYQDSGFPIVAKDFRYKSGRYLISNKETCCYSEDLEHWAELPVTSTRVAFSPDGTKVSILEPSTIRVYDTEAKKEIGIYDFEKDLIPGFWQSHPLRWKFAPPKLRN